MYVIFPSANKDDDRYLLLLVTILLFLSSVNMELYFEFIKVSSLSLFTLLAYFVYLDLYPLEKNVHSRK